MGEIDKRGRGRAEVRHLGIDAQEGAEAEEGVLLLHIVADAAQGAAPGSDEVAQVGRQLGGAHPRHPPQRDGTAHKKSCHWPSSLRHR